MNFHTQPNELGFYGEFGGAYIPELLRKPVEEIKTAFNHYKSDDSFNQEVEQFSRDYIGRPTPLYYSSYLSEYYGAQIYLNEKTYVIQAHIKSTIPLVKFSLLKG